MYQKLCLFKLLGFEEPMVKIFARYVTFFGMIHNNCFHVVLLYVHASLCAVLFSYEKLTLDMSKARKSLVL